MAHSNKHAHNDHSHDAHAPHITPFAVYVKVALGLFALTFLTVGAHAVHEILGGAAPIVAFLIAAVKAFLVMYYFMHMKYENFENRITFALGFFFLLLLFGISVTDILSRHAVAIFQ